MSGRLASLPPRTLVVLAASAVLVYVFALWFLLVSPKRSEAARLGDDIAAAELRLVEAEAALNRPRAAGGSVSDVFRLAKAMPRSVDQSSLVLELSRLADTSGVTLRSITPQTPVVGLGGATLIPVVVAVGGSYFEISRFLARTRTLVRVRRGKIYATGRLFTVQNVEMVESQTEGFPSLDGTITLNAYVYDGPIAPAEAPAPLGDELQPANGTSAAGSTS